jgi:hypothetical protein
MPVVALVLGIAVLGEGITAGAVAGLVLIAFGAWLATGGPASGGRGGGSPVSRGAPASQRGAPGAAAEVAERRQLGRRSCG